MGKNQDVTPPLLRANIEYLRCDPHPDLQECFKRITPVINFSLLNKVYLIFEMTNREKEILGIIRDNPSITHQELANRLGISKNSVGVHISNLIKKGHILGKGYLLKDEEFVTVIGGCNMDLQGTSIQQPIPADSNPGHVTISPGGVGRNIAENLARLSIKTNLLSVLGDDLYGQKIIRDSEAAGIDMNHCLVKKEGITSTYLSILGPSGELEIAIADMKILEDMSTSYLQKKVRLIEHAGILVLDANLPLEILEFITNSFPQQTIYLDPVSSRKAMKIKGILQGIHTLKPNRLEAEILTGIKIHNHGDLKQVARIFLDQGLQQIVISLGAEGVFFADQEQQGLITAPAIQLKNCTGAGDALFAGLIHGALQGFSLRQSVIFGMGASILALTRENSTNLHLNREQVEKILQEYEL